MGEASEPGPADAAFCDFYARTFRDLSVYGWSLTLDAQAADELAQEALSRVYARWARLREPRPYAFRIVRNLARDGRASSMRETDAWRSLPAAGSIDAPDTGTLDAVRRLPPALRDAVLLHYYADLPVEGVARVLRRPVGTVKRRLHEARAVLATSLEGAR